MTRMSLEVSGSAGSPMKIMFYLGMSRFCPYCNSKVSVTADGKPQVPASR